MMIPGWVLYTKTKLIFKISLLKIFSRALDLVFAIWLLSMKF